MVWTRGSTTFPILPPTQRLDKLNMQWVKPMMVITEINTSYKSTFPAYSVNYLAMKTDGGLQHMVYSSSETLLFCIQKMTKMKSSLMI